MDSSLLSFPIRRRTFLLNTLNGNMLRLFLNKIFVRYNSCSLINNVKRRQVTKFRKPPFFFSSILLIRSIQILSKSEKHDAVYCSKERKEVTTINCGVTA